MSQFPELPEGFGLDPSKISPPVFKSTFATAKWSGSTIPLGISQTAFEDDLLMPPKSLSASEAINLLDALLGGKFLAHCLAPIPPSFSDRFYARWQAAVECGKQHDVWAADRDLRMNAGRN